MLSPLDTLRWAVAHGAEGVAFSGLQPDTLDAYRVGDGTVWSGQYSFATADPKARSYKFLIFGDSQAPVAPPDPYGIWRKTVQNAFAANADARFMINVGDLVDYGQSGEHWNAWFAAASE